MLKSALAASCTLTIAATGYLSLSLIVLHPPRANYAQWFPSAALFLAQGTLTLVALGIGSSTGRHSDRLRPVLIAGACAIVWMGVSWVWATVTSAHFEGYALVLGSALAVQGALTLAVFLRARAVLLAR